MIKPACLKFTFILLALSIAFTFNGCSPTSDKDLTKNRALLDEADLYMEFGQLSEAKSKASEVIKNVSFLIAKQPSDISYLLLHARALLTKFLITNSSVISNAPLQPKSLVRIPQFNDYIGYDRYILVALIDLKKAQEIGAPLRKDQSAALHAMLASIYRLNMNTMSKANVQYKHAIKSYRAHLLDLKRDKPNVGTNNFAQTQVKNQIRLLTISRAEVKLTMHKWDMALRVLKQMMGGDSLEYFDLMFNKIETKIASLKDEAIKDHERTPEKAKIIADIVAKKRNPSTKAKELAGYSAYQINIMQAEIELASLKNNLMYRIICYHWLSLNSKHNDARIVLRKYYPILDSELSHLLKNSK